MVLLALLKRQVIEDDAAAGFEGRTRHQPRFDWLVLADVQVANANEAPVAEVGRFRFDLNSNICEFKLFFSLKHGV